MKDEGGNVVSTLRISDPAPLILIANRGAITGFTASGLLCIQLM